MPVKRHPPLIALLGKGLSTVDRANIYVEIGIRKGATFNKVAPYFREAHAVDIEAGSFDHIKGNANLVWHHSTSDEFNRSWDRGEIIDLAFIDGDHRHEQSLKDFIEISKHVRRGVLIVMHDTYPEDESWLRPEKCDDTYKTADYIRRNLANDFEIVTLPFFHGVSIVRKSEVQLDWKD